MTRTEFEKITRHLYQSILNVIRDVLKEAKRDKSAIDEIVMVGGASRIPKVCDIIKKFMGKEILNESLNADQDIAHGAALFAATQGNVRHEKLENFLLNEVSSYSLGVQVDDQKIDVLIPKNRQIPVRVKKEYTTQQVDDKYVDIRVFEIIDGNSLLCADNRLVGEFRLNGIKAKPEPGKSARKPLIEVTFAMNASGSLIVNAQDKYSGAKDDIGIEINTPTHIGSSEITLMKNQYKQIIEFNQSQQKLQEYWCTINEKVNHSEKNMKKYRNILDEVKKAKGCWMNLFTKEDLDIKLEKLMNLCQMAGLKCEDSDNSDSDGIDFGNSSDCDSS